MSAVRVEVSGPVLTITLNRPTQLNAVDSEVSALVGGALERLAGDDDLRVGVITGAGTAFCAGADVKELAAGRTVHDPAHP